MQVGNAVTLSENWEFRRAYGRGKSYVHPALVCYCLKTKRPQVRVGITAAKKVGGAVQRNRARRIIREAFRGMSDRVAPGYDLVFVARAATLSRKSTQIAGIMQGILEKAGVIR